MASFLLKPSSASLGCVALVLVGLCAPAGALGATKPARPQVSAVGSLAQLPGKAGCLVDRSTGARGSKAPKGCRRVRALGGPAPFLGSNAIAISPDGRNVYVASSSSDAIAVFTRNARTGKLTQRVGRRRLHRRQGRQRLREGARARRPELGRRQRRRAERLRDLARQRRRRQSSAATATTGALTQLPGGGGCIANARDARLHHRPRARRPRRRRRQPRRQERLRRRVRRQRGRGVHAQHVQRRTHAARPTPTGCIVNAPTSGCATGLALDSPGGHGGQRRRRQRLRRGRGQQRGRRVHPRRLDRRADAGDRRHAAASSTARSPAARPARSSTAPTRSRSAPTTATST